MRMRGVAGRGSGGCRCGSRRALGGRFLRSEKRRCLAGSVALGRGVCSWSPRGVG